MHYTTTTGWAQFGVRFESLYAVSVDLLCGVIVVGSTIVAVLVAASMWDVSASHAHTVHLSLSRLKEKLRVYEHQVRDVQRQHVERIAAAQQEDAEPADNPSGSTSTHSHAETALGSQQDVAQTLPGLQHDSVPEAHSGAGSADAGQHARDTTQQLNAEIEALHQPHGGQQDAQLGQEHDTPHRPDVNAPVAAGGALEQRDGLGGGRDAPAAAANAVEDAHLRAVHQEAPAGHGGDDDAAGGAEQAAGAADAAARRGQEGGEAQDAAGPGDQPQLFMEDPWEGDPDAWPDDGGPIMIEDMLGLTGDIKTAASYMLAAHILLGMLIACFVFLPGILGRSCLSSLRKRSAWPLVFAPEALFWGRGVSGGVPLSLHGMWASNLAATAQAGLGAVSGDWLYPTGLLALTPQLPLNEDRVGEWPLNPDDTYEVLVGYVVLVLSAALCAGLDELARWAVVARKRLAFSHARAPLSLVQLWRGMRAGDAMPDGPLAGTPCTPGDAELLQYDIERNSMLLGPVSGLSPLLAAVMVWAKVALMFLARMMIQPVLIGLACDALLQPFLGQTYAHVLAEYVANFFLAMLYRWALGMFVLLLGVTVLLTVRDLLHPRVLAAQLRAFAPREAVFEPMAKRSLTLQCRSAASTMAFLTVMLGVALYLPLALTGWTPAGQPAHRPPTDTSSGNMSVADPSVLWKQLHHTPWEQWSVQSTRHRNEAVGQADPAAWCRGQEQQVESLLPPRLHHAAAAGLPPSCNGTSGVYMGGLAPLPAQLRPASPARIVDLVGGDGRPELQYVADIQYVDGHSLLGHSMDSQMVRVQLRVHNGGAAPAKRPYGAITRYLTATDHSVWQSFAPWLCLQGGEGNASSAASVASAIAPPLRVCSSASGLEQPPHAGPEIPLLALEAVNLTHLLGIFPGAPELLRETPLALVESAAKAPESEKPAAEEQDGENLEPASENADHRAENSEVPFAEHQAEVDSDGFVDIASPDEDEVSEDSAEAPPTPPPPQQLGGGRSIQFSFISQMLLPIKDTEYSMALHKYPAEARQSLAVLQSQISRRIGALRQIEAAAQPAPEAPLTLEVHNETVEDADSAEDDTVQDIIADVLYVLAGPYVDLPALVGTAASWVLPHLLFGGSSGSRQGGVAHTQHQAQLEKLTAWHARVNDTIQQLDAWHERNAALLADADPRATDEVPLTLGDAMDVASKLQHSAPLVGTVWHSFRLFSHAAEIDHAQLAQWLGSLEPAQREAVVQNARKVARRAASKGGVFADSWLADVLWVASQPQHAAMRVFNATAEAGVRAVTDYLFSAPGDADSFEEASRQGDAAPHDDVLLLNATMPLAAVWPALDYRLRSAMAACVSDTSGSGVATSPPVDMACLASLGKSMPAYAHMHHMRQARSDLPALGNFSIVGSVWGHLPAGQMPHISTTRLGRRAPVGRERAASSATAHGNSSTATPLQEASALLQPSISARAEQLFAWFSHSMFKEAWNDSRALLHYTHDSCSTLVGVPRSAACGVLAWVVAVVFGVLVALPLVMLRWGSRLALEHTPRPVLFLASYHSLPIQKLADLMVAEIGLTVLMDPFRTLMWWWAIAWVTGFARLLGIRRYVLPQADEVVILRPVQGVPVQTQPSSNAEASPAWQQAVVEGQELPALSLPADEMRDIAREAGPVRMPHTVLAGDTHVHVPGGGTAGAAAAGTAAAEAAPAPAALPEVEANAGDEANGEGNLQREAAAARAVVAAVAGKPPSAATLQQVVPLGEPSTASKWAVSSRLPLYYLRIPDLDRTVAVVQRLPVRHSPTERSPTHVAWRDSCFWVSDPSKLPMGKHDVLDYVEQWREDYQKAEAVATLVMHRAETREAAAKYRRFTVGGAIWELQGGNRRRRGRAERAIGAAGEAEQDDAAFAAGEAVDDDDDVPAAPDAVPNDDAQGGNEVDADQASEATGSSEDGGASEGGTVDYATMQAQRQAVRRALRALDATEKGDTVAVGATAVASLQDTVPQEARDAVLARVPEAAVLPDEAVLSQMRISSDSLAGGHDFSMQILLHTPDKTPVQRFLAALDLVSVYTLRIPLLIVLATITLWLGMLWVLNVSFALGRLVMAFAGMPVQWMHDPWGVFMGGFVLLSLLEWVFLVHMGTFAVFGSLIRTVNFDVVRRSRGLLGAFLRCSAVACIVALGASHRLSLRVALAFRGDVHVPRVASLTRLLRTLAVFVVMVILIPALLGNVLLSLRDPMQLSVPQQAEQYACSLRAVQQLSTEVQQQLAQDMSQKCVLSDAQWDAIEQARVSVWESMQPAKTNSSLDGAAATWESMQRLDQELTTALQHCVNASSLAASPVGARDLGSWMHLAGHLPPTWAHLQLASSPWRPLHATASSAAALGSAPWGLQGNDTVLSRVAQVAGDAERALDATMVWAWDNTLGQGAGEVLTTPAGSTVGMGHSEAGPGNATRQLVLRGAAGRGVWRWLNWYRLQRATGLSNSSAALAPAAAGPSGQALEQRLADIQAATCGDPGANAYGTPAPASGKVLDDAWRSVVIFMNDVAALPFMRWVPSLAGVHLLGMHLVVQGGLRGFMTLWFVGFAVIAGMNQGLWMGCCGRRAQRLPQRVAHSVLRGRAMWLHKNVVAPSSKALLAGAAIVTLLRVLALYATQGLLHQPSLEQWCSVAATAAAALDETGQLPTPLQPVLGERWAPANFSMRRNFSALPQDPQLARELPAEVCSPVMHAREWSLFSAALVPHVAASAVDPGTAPPRMPLMQLAAAAIPRTLWPLPLSGDLERAWGGAVHAVLASPPTTLAMCGERWTEQMHAAETGSFWSVALDRSGLRDPIARLGVMPVVMHLAPLAVAVAALLAFELGDSLQTLHEHLYRREYAVGENLLPLPEGRRQQQARQGDRRPRR